MTQAHSRAGGGKSSAGVSGEGGGGSGERRRRRKPVLKELSGYNDMEEGDELCVLVVSA